MIKCERKTLNLVKKHFSTDHIIYLDEENHLLICEQIKIPYKYKDMGEIIMSLANQGLFTLHRSQVDIYFSINYNGVHDFEKKVNQMWINFFTKWIPAFISGVLVGTLAPILSRLIVGYVLLHFEGLLPQ